MIVLVGSGEYLPSMEAVDRGLMDRLHAPPRVVCLPTAAGNEGPERISYWSRLGVEHFSGLGAQVEALPVVDRSSASDPELAGRIAAANFVYFSGGKPDYLYRALSGSLAWDAVLCVLARGGLLAGCSAGAMVMGEKFFGFPAWMSGFGLLPGLTVIPHFDEIPDSAISAIMKPLQMPAGGDLTVVGVDGHTALIRHPDGYEVAGSGSVTLWNTRGRVRYTSGPVPQEAFR